MDKTSSNYSFILICTALVSVTFITFSPLFRNGFVNYDDDQYVTKNQNVQAGLTAKTIKWAFTAKNAGNWHPLTWLSHMLDCQLFGLDPKWHHIVNLLFHTANTLLLFWVLKDMTGALWQSAFVAAAFALHPLHVESVAWAAERKDVLSTLFWLLTMAAYLRYVRRHNITWYIGTLVLFALGLMAKPMLVTLPFVLLLLDYWPLKRLTYYPLSAIRYPLLEKLPFFALSAISCVIAFFAQRSAGAVVGIHLLSLKRRIANVPLSYLGYIGKTVWPAKLAVFYPYNIDRSLLLQVAIAVLVLLGISVLVLRLALKRRYLFTGWFWYLGTLVPVIGLLQVGSQSMADRYTYLPLTGLFIIIAWGISDILTGWQHRKIVLGLSSLAVLSALSICTYVQVHYWRDTITLFEHALKAASENDIPHINLGVELASQGKFDQALSHYNRALQLNPKYSKTYSNLGIALKSMGRLDDAITNYRRAIELEPGYTEAYNNLGNAFRLQGKYDEAVDCLRRAIALNPDIPDIHYNLGLTFQLQDKPEEAIVYFRQAIRLKPDWASPLDSLASLLATTSDPALRDPNEAIALARRSVELSQRRNASMLDTLASAYAAAGRFDDAVTTAQAALDLALADMNYKLAAQIRKNLQLYKQQKSL